METIPITGLFTGRAVERWPGKPPSAIGKSAAEGQCTVTLDGIAGDEQADLTVHGGPEKAIHHYPADAYPLWQAELGEAAAAFGPGHFGENVSTSGWTEDDVAIGDVFRLGTARVQICQGRQPCWKLVSHTGVEQMAFLVRKTARTGWYYRVLEEGTVSLGDSLARESRDSPEWTVRRVTSALFDRRLEPALAAEIAALPALAQEWRAIFIERAGG